jgi:hypothetical protein
MLVSDPLAPLHDFLMQHGNVCGWATEGSEAEFECQPGKLAHGGMVNDAVAMIIADINRFAI